MTDNFVRYGSNQPHPNSPGYFPSQFMDDFTGTDMQQFDMQFMGDRTLSTQKIEESLENRTTTDAYSNDSQSSSNYSSKHSPNIHDNNENQTIIDRDEQKNSSVLKKGIQKHYESIVDNGVAYTYDEDPVEYKKARKRIQNRESASRVRNKKKNYVEELEDDMVIVKKENAELKVENAALRAENNLLKQQTCFLERMVMKSGSQPMMNPHSMMHPQPMMNNQHHSMMNSHVNRGDPNFEECLLPLVNKYDEKSPRPQATGYFRTAPPHTFKKHMAMLGVFTILICCYGLIGKGQDDSIQLFYPNSLSDFKNSNTFSIKGLNRSGGLASQNQDFDNALGALLKANQEYNSIKRMGGMLFTTSYIIYLIYVLLVANWKYLLKIKSKKYL